MLKYIFIATVKCFFLRDPDHRECDAASRGRWFPLLQRNMWHSFLRFKVHCNFFRILNSWWWRWYIPFKSWEPLSQFVRMCATGHQKSNVLPNSSLITVLTFHLMSSKFEIDVMSYNVLMKFHGTVYAC